MFVFPKEMCAGQRGVAAQSDLCRRREPAQAELVAGRDEKSRFGQVHLTRDELHPRCVARLRKKADGRGISCEGLVSKGIHLRNRQMHCASQIPVRLLWGAKGLRVNS